MKYNYVLFSTSFSPYKYMYKEIMELDYVQIFWEKENLLGGVSKIERKIAKWWMHPKINKIVSLPGKNKWYYRALKKIKFKENLPICFLYHYNFIKEIQNGWVDYLREIYPESRHVFSFSDPSYMSTDIIESLNQKMDLVSVFDPEMAKKYGISFLPNVYPSLDNSNPTYCEYDLCFIGADKGREAEIVNIAKACKENGIRAVFLVHIKGYDKRDLNNDLSIEYLRSKKPYAETLEIVKKSKCILELKVEPYSTCSLRIQEAVILGKRILTNNENVYKMPCCKNSNYIQYYKKIEEIDWNFIKEDSKADYQYNDEYSAKRWLEKIASVLI